MGQLGALVVVWYQPAASGMVRRSDWAAKKISAGVVAQAVASSQSRSDEIELVPRSSRESVGLLTPLMSASSP